MIQDLLNGFLLILNFNTIIAITAGVGLGIILGAIPGLTATMAIAVVIPLTFYMNPILSISMLIGAYKGGVYGGSISAILLGTPGTDSAAATVMDGYEMAKQGKSGKALKMALYASVFGDLSSMIALIFLAPIIAKFSLKIGPGEFFTLIIFSLTIIVGVGGKSMAKTLIAAFAGFFVATIGVDPMLGTQRLTFGIIELQSGVSILPMLIGLFAVPELLIQLEMPISASTPVLFISKKLKDNIVTVEEFIKSLKPMLFGSGVGIIIGAIPGIGPSVSCWLSYKIARDNSKYPEKFGTGVIEGIAAPEAGNNATVGGALIPMLTLGIPGSTTVAILMTAFIMQGVFPGPLIFQENKDLVYGVFSSLIFSNIVLLVVGYLIIKYISPFLCNFSKIIFLPIIIGFCFVGAFAINTTVFDMNIMVIFGIIGYFMRKTGFPVAPFLISMILEPYAESNLRRFLILSRGSIMPIFFKPIAVLFILLTFISLYYFLRKKN